MPRTGEATLKGKKEDVFFPVLTDNLKEAQEWM